MAISSTKKKIIYTCAIGTTVYAYDFKILDDDHLVVEKYLIATAALTTLTKTTDYTVSGVGVEAGGNVTLNVALANTYKLIIRRVVPLTQESDYVPNDPLPTEVLEEDLDKSVMIDQQLSEQIERAVLQDPTQSSQVTFPSPTDGNVIGWSGTTLVNLDPEVIGMSGYSGYSGISGYSGYSGFSGKSGYSSYSGYSGFSGKSGYSGPSGYSGINGTSGYSSYSGFSGTSGYSGYSGPSGWSGYSGPSGWSGYSGPSGFSGPSGYSGPSGFSGYSGNNYYE